MKLEIGDNLGCFLLLATFFTGVTLLVKACSCA